ncbi:nudC domain-containing protein 1 [Monomorium pharaonis]|uniref:nudC domain-containing protein 1 n=1 Tax=Monomorium pharaonis TaxID=307658 RepID=UPI00063F0BEB|nr:nudC domain-containing protein 1 [Monomorium pharaonis]XP_012522266.1 nudC domain-containing protein 1 [Monomorium pharaonis]XP_036140258.1 nudC domain-containing protein 1 [Monomorium pharaonis]
MTDIIELRPDKSLTNSSFEKYQFSNETILIISENKLCNYVYRLEPNQNQESWLEARLFAFHNHLFNNVHDMSCWFIDETSAVWRLDKDGSLDQVYKLHTDGCLSNIIYNPSIGFTSNNIVVISNGDKNLHILIGYTGENKKVFLITLEEPGIIMNVQYVAKSSRIILTMCAIAVGVNQKKYTQLILLSYHLYTENEITKVNNVDKQILKVQGSVDYVYVEENGNYLHSICQDNIGFENENVQEKESVTEQSSVASNSQIKIPKYYWSQDEESVTVWIKVPKQHSDKRPKINVKPLELSVTIDNEILIQGQCQHRLEENMATWRHKEDTLQIDLSKYESGLMWNELIKGDTGGECLPNEVLAAEIHARLAHLCTDQQTNSVGEDQPCVGFNTEELEECDLEGKDNFLQRINLLTQMTTHLSRLGSNNHVLFTYKRKQGQMVCLRYDHDACVWEMGNGNGNTHWNLKHIHSFPGFGYVEASKTNKKFCVSPIDGSYIAIVEHTRHVFVYERPDVRAGSAKQRIVDLNCEASPIMGVVATNKFLIVLSKDKLYRLQVHM